MGREIRRFVDQNIPVFLVSEDVSVRGISTDEIMTGIEQVSHERIAGLLNDYDQIWHW